MDPTASRSRPPLRRAVGTGADLLARVRQRADALAGLGDPSVLAPTSVGADAQGRVLVELPAVDGTDLAELASARGPLSAGECAWLARRLGAALTAMHGAGLAHGDIAPANVAVNARGVVVLDTVGACVDGELGTPGFRAPERTSGATLPGDVYSLGALLRWAVCERDRPLVEAWTSPLMVSAPGERPPAQVATRALARVAPEAAITRPVSADVVAAARARAAPRTERTAEGRWWRVRRHAERASAMIAVAGGAAAIIVGVPRLVDATLGEPHAVARAAGVEAPGGAERSRGMAPAGNASVTGSDGWAVVAATSTGAAPAALRDRDHPERAAVALTLARIAALHTGNGDALRAVVSTSAAADALAGEVEAVAADLDAGALSYTGLDVEILEAQVSGDDGEAAVALAYRIGPHTVIDGGVESRVEAVVERVELELAWEGGWTVAAVSPAG